MEHVHSLISNRDFIAGQPALNVREMFINHDDLFNVDVIGAWLFIDLATAEATIEKLVESGYLEILNHHDNVCQLTRTALAIALVKSAPYLPLSRASTAKVVLELLQEIRLVNASPLAHRIDSIELHGSLLTNPVDDPQCIQAEINVSWVMGNRLARTAKHVTSV
ncbi:MAG: hypothetical protein Q7T66_16040 [Herminiimonas sp.]|uniref:hypothetical protein n=1 Tax=Herminiimonas sp. TaxID=1926289 RepID=UPI00271DB3B2|nr:hypothetical protein [Herminiimonas sp.]MDO9422172.1 hypothetical protein [Herminiimonas sp.]